ncbi:hypothetical protein, partial [Yeosuana aromativorans]|uniref:hypothetical protein n=1 Tax=Yeosuana aromativorans TaxID=288019 RepID=UPI001E35BE4C
VVANAMKKTISIIIFLILIFSCSRKTNNNWNKNSELFGTWVKLERDSKGYLIYDPCNGINKSVTINKDIAIYDLSQETPDTLKIDSIKILNSSNEIEFSGTQEFYSMKSLIKVIDFDKKLYLLKWELTPKNNPNYPRKGKMMMTKKDFEKDFRFIDNPCDYDRVAEKEFLPIEYD